MMTRLAPKHQVLREAKRMEQKIKSLWPNILTEISLETQDEEHAYVYITAPAEDAEEISWDMIDLTLELYERAEIYITGRINWGRPR